MTMDRIDTFQAADASEPIDPAAETVINGAPYDAQKALQDVPERAAEEIKRRLTAVAELDGAAQRDTVGG
jgi:hypothetical protein